MNKLYKIRLISGKRGLSLVEILVSLALLSMIVVMLFSVLMISFNTINANAVLKDQDAEAAGSVEKDYAGVGSRVPEKEQGTFAVDFGGVKVYTDGDFIEGTDEGEDSVFHYFNPR